MTQALTGVQTAANYPNFPGGAGTILGPDTLAYHLDLVVGNAAALVELFTTENPGLGPQGGVQVTNEFVIVAGPGQVVQASWDNCLGFRAKDFVPGTHATVYATLYELGDPTPLGGSAYSGTLSGSGGSGGGTLNAVTGSVSVSGAVPTIVSGSGFSVAHAATGTWTITFTNPFATAPICVGNARDTNPTVIITFTNPLQGSVTLNTNVPGTGAVDGASFDFVAFLPQ